MSALSVLTSRPGLWYWLAACVLAWLAAHALASSARLVWPDATTAEHSYPVAVDPALLPQAPAGWQAAGSNTPASIPTTDLPYSVVGKALGTREATSLVVLTTPDGQQALMVGDEIQPGIELAGFDDRGIILSRQGRLERLPWPEATNDQDPITQDQALPASNERATAASQDRPVR